MSRSHIYMMYSLMTRLYLFQIKYNKLNLLLQYFFCHKIKSWCNIHKYSMFLDRTWKVWSILKQRNQMYKPANNLNNTRKIGPNFSFTIFLGAFWRLQGAYGVGMWKNIDGIGGSFFNTFNLYLIDKHIYIDQLSKAHVHGTHIHSNT